MPSRCVGSIRQMCRVISRTHGSGSFESWGGSTHAQLLSPRGYSSTSCRTLISSSEKRRVEVVSVSTNAYLIQSHWRAREAHLTDEGVVEGTCAFGGGLFK